MKQNPKGKSDFNRRQCALTNLRESPFFVFGATLHDNRRRLLSLADDKMLELDEELCKKLRAELTNPRLRLKHETAWLPKIDASRVGELIQKCEKEPMALFSLSKSLPKLTQFNLVTFALRYLDTQTSRKQIVEFITHIGFITTRLFPGEIINILNEERTVSRFPIIESLEEIEAELEERRIDCVNEVIKFIDRLPSKKLIEVMTDVAEVSTIGGSRQTNAFIDAIIDRYELETKEILDNQVTYIDKLITEIKYLGKFGEARIVPYILKLERVTRNWDMIAQPIQVSTKARGLEHQVSQTIAYNIRSLAIDLFNEYQMVSSVQRLNTMLSVVFAEVPDVLEKIEEDENTLSEILS